MYAKSPLISIICPCYNSGESLERMILSVLAQDYTDYELIVVDGKSSDCTTLGILEKYAKKIICISEKDDGIYDAMNKGVELARGKWFYFIGADDYFYDSAVLNRIFGKGNNINEGVGLIVVKFSEAETAPMDMNSIRNIKNIFSFFNKFISSV